MSLTPSEKAKFKDRRWRLSHLYRIKDKFQKTVKLTLNPVQNILIAALEKSTRLIDVLKARQLGISTFFLIYYLDDTIWTPNTTTAIISHKQDSMRKLFAIIRRAVKYMDPRIAPRLDKGGGSAYEMRFPEIDSKIYCTLEAVSDTVNNLHISERALMETDEKSKTSIDAVTKNGRISNETTPRGFNHFYDHWVDPNGFKKFFFPWFLDPYYCLETSKLKNYTEDEWDLKKKAKLTFKKDLTDGQIAWRRAKIKEKGNDVKNFLQEFPEDDQSCFLASGDCPFDQSVIAKMRMDAPEPISGKWNETDRGWTGWKKFTEYDKSKNYVLSADPAEGVGSDFSVFKVLEVKKREECFVFRSNKIKPKDFADEMIKVANEYWTGGRIKPLIIVERNNHGHAVLLRLETQGYENIFVHNDERPGWLSNRVTRPLMLDALKELVEDGFCQIKDKQTLTECLTMIDNDGKWEALDGKNDDTVIAHAIAIQGCIKSGVLDIYDNISAYLRT